MYVRELLETQPSNGIVIVGYSIGGTLAFEMTRQLEAGGTDVALLALIDARFPPRPEDAGRPAAVAALPRPVPPPHRRLWRRMVTNPIKRTVTRHCIRTGMRLPRFMGIRTRYFWKMLATSRDAYSPGPVTAPMLVLGAEGTARAHEDTWLTLAAGGGQVTEIPTDHLALVREPWVQELSHNLHQTVVGALGDSVDNGARV